MGRRIDILGQKFNRLLVIKYHGNDKSGNALWECLCDCGNKKIGCSQSLRGGGLKSCGCSTSLDKSEGHIKHGWKVGGENPTEYVAWGNMVQRCTNSNHPSYKDYGGRGIKVCERWLSFEYFIEDMGPKPTPEYSIDRFPDNDGHYEPGNTRWATDEQQARNKRGIKWVDNNGERMIVRDWANKYGVCEKRLSEQLKIRSFDDAVIFLLNPSRKKEAYQKRMRRVGSFKDGVLIKEYRGIVETVADGFSRASVTQSLKRGIRHKEFHWKYLDDKAA